MVLWAHQGALTLTPGHFTRLFQIPAAFNLAPTSRRVFKFAGVTSNDRIITSHVVFLHFLLAICAILWYIYTGLIRNKVDFREFLIQPAIVEVIVSPPLEYDKFVPNDALVVELPSCLVKFALRKDILQVTEDYGMWDLTQLCRQHM